MFDHIFAGLAGEGPKPERIMIDATHLKAHRTAASLLKKGGPRRIGRTKGGLNSKLHTVCDGEGRPIILLLSEGQMSDHKGARLVLDALPPATTRDERMDGSDESTLSGASEVGSRTASSGWKRPFQHSTSYDSFRTKRTFGSWLPRPIPIDMICVDVRSRMTLHRIPGPSSCNSGLLPRCVQELIDKVERYARAHRIRVVAVSQDDDADLLGRQHGDIGGEAVGRASLVEENGSVEVSCSMMCDRLGLQHHICRVACRELRCVHRPRVPSQIIAWA